MCRFAGNAAIGWNGDAVDDKARGRRTHTGEREPPQQALPNDQIEPIYHCSEPPARVHLGRNAPSIRRPHDAGHSLYDRRIVWVSADIGFLDAADRRGLDRLGRAAAQTSTCNMDRPPSDDRRRQCLVDQSRTLCARHERNSCSRLSNARFQVATAWRASIQRTGLELRCVLRCQFEEPN